MIQRENIIIAGTELIRTYSDEGRYIVRDGIEYEEAIDPVDSGRVYTEGEEMDNATPEEIISILTGGAL